MRDVAFRVEPDELETTIAMMRRCETAMAEATAELERDMARLQTLWHGEAADAQRLAQDEWSRGLVSMRAALATYRLGAERAHANYVAAAQANARMWAQTR